MAAEPTADFLLLLARALHEAGQPSHLLEQTLERAAGRLGLTVDAFCVPTAVLLSFEHAGGTVAWVPLASGLIILLPGLSLVDAVEELASGNLASGAARLAGVGVGFLALTFGVLAGLHVADLLPLAVTVPREPLPRWVIVPA